MHGAQKWSQVCWLGSLVVFLFAPYYVGVGNSYLSHPHPIGVAPILWPVHYSLFYTMTHLTGQFRRDFVIRVASMFAGYLLLVLLVALAATRQARHVSLRWTGLLWLATAVLTVEVVSVAENARELLPPS